MVCASKYKCSECDRENDSRDQFCGACGSRLSISRPETPSVTDNQSDLSTFYCNVHQDTQTQLRCGRCDIPVCPKCMTHSPVGVRCPRCSKPTPMPQYEVQTHLLLRALGVAILMGILGGFVIGFIVEPLFGQLFAVISIAAWAYLLAETVSFSTNKKRGPKLTIIASSGILICSIIIALMHLPFISLLDLTLLPALGIYMVYSRLR